MTRHLEVRLHPLAVKELNSLDDKTKDRILNKLRELPHTFSQTQTTADIRKIKGTKKNIDLYRLRVGDHRITFEYKDNTLWIARISHRSQAYK